MGRHREPYTQIYLHIVWATWKRMPLVMPAIQREVYSSIHAECDRLRAAPLAIGGMDDHVHVLVRLPTSISIGDLVKQMKGATSHLINHMGPERHRLRWQGGYGAFSICKRHVPVVTRYILRQPEHHRLGTLSPALEHLPDA